MARTVVVLLVEDDPDYVTLVQAWLAASKDTTFQVVHAATLSAGIDRLRDGNIDLILLDLSLPDSEGPETFHVLRAQAQRAPIILLSGHDGEALALELVSGGAQDYLVKGSCTGEVLTRAILYALLRPRQPSVEASVRAARVIGLLSAKGGVGLTTLACVLASELQDQDQGGVLLADLDMRANGVSFLLGIKPSYSLRDALVNTHRLDESNWGSIVSHAPAGFDVLPSPVLQGHDELEPELTRQLLNRLSLFYAWIVLDIGRLSSRSLALLQSVHQTLLVTSASLASLHETRRAVSTLHNSGWDEERLLLAVSELPGAEKLGDSSIEEMVGAPVRLRLADSSADLNALAAKESLPNAGSRYRKSAAELARSLTGAPEESPPTTRRIAQALGWR